MYRCTYICTHRCTYIHPSIHPSIHTYIHTYLHTYIHTYLHTYIHTYIRTLPVAWSFVMLFSGVWELWKNCMLLTSSCMHGADQQPCIRHIQKVTCMYIHTYIRPKPSRRSGGKLILEISFDFCARVHMYVHTYLPTYLPTYLRTYLHTYIHTDIHRYIHTYILTKKRQLWKIKDTLTTRCTADKQHDILSVCVSILARYICA